MKWLVEPIARLIAPMVADLLGLPRESEASRKEKLDEAARKRIEEVRRTLKGSDK